MDPFLNAQCSIAFETVMKSPLGQSCISFFESFHIDYEQIFPISFIREKLAKNLYNSPKEFLVDVKTIFEECGSSINSDSTIAYSLQTLSYLLEEKIKQLREFKPEQFVKSIYEFSDLIHSVLPELPDNFTEFQETLKKIHTEPKIKEQEADIPSSDENEKIDPNQLFERVLKLKTDTELSNVIDIIVRYENSYNHEFDMLKVDFRKCQDYTLRIIKNYIDSLEIEETDKIEQNK